MARPDTPARRRRAAGRQDLRETDIFAVREIVIAPSGLPGLLRTGEGAIGLVLFAHGSGSSRLSPRNNYVAERMAEAGVASLLVDLLTEDEERDRRNVFDIALLAERLGLVTRWAAGVSELAALPLAYFGASTGAAAALVAAAAPEAEIAAIVSRGGRPDLAGDALDRVRAPTLLIVGGADTEVLALNREALAALRCEKRLDIVPGATHLFEEPGALDTVSDLAARWFRRHLAAEAAP